MNIKIDYSSYPRYPSSSWKVGSYVWVGPTTQTSTYGYQLRIAHLVDKDKYIYNKGNIRKGTTMQPIMIIQNPKCNAQTTHA
jgi:hypothetical protein